MQRRETSADRLCLHSHRHGHGHRLPSPSPRSLSLLYGLVLQTDVNTHRDISDNVCCLVLGWPWHDVYIVVHLDGLALVTSTPRAVRKVQIFTAPSLATSTPGPQTPRRYGHSHGHIVSLRCSASLLCRRETHSCQTRCQIQALISKCDTHSHTQKKVCQDMHITTYLQAC
jgi:hypothetical protein